MYIGRVLKEGVTGVIPYQPGIALGNVVLAALDHIYVREGKVFEGSVDDHMELAHKAGISGLMVENHFDELENEGWITIDGDSFTPLEPLISRYY